VVGPIVSAAAEKGLEETAKQAKAYAIKFLSRNAAFLQDPSTIASLKDARKSPEYLSMGRYVNDRRGRVLLQLGIVWRSYASNKERMERERSKVIPEHGLPGLHLAEAVQGGLLRLIETALMRMGLSQKVFEAEMRAVVDSIDEYVTFIPAESTEAEELSVILHKARTYYPRVFVVAGSGTAKELAVEVSRLAGKKLPMYELARDDQGQQVAFVFTVKL
jgi:hypothetical protein